MSAVVRWGVALVALMACGGDGGGASDKSGGGGLLDFDPVCIDDDMDGYGKNCEGGEDCDDRDDTVFEDCGACTETREGCDCEAGSAPVECKIPTSMVGESNILCKTGKRYCRDGLWTACLGVAGYSK